ncbi:type 1 glutamine amidotransferase domain-containing protein [Clostridium estertheticum]|uniref:Type 1 glutamine amidotransferase domain-containing protein n=1 Tax=Clostridium estertheticum TaxID=238834 RepID=A0A7Y3WT34_9CLOT|nr:type 1 glutamine amidotransferase domain-containing protein [Clostridium estertheticum]NNU76603.1 type 1 glutamine amidotransferase domain-containing protein [Clostridium estertheticum]WBL45343.1 type 1 glutamine amidotransferase domain-containing protein [Clostridium estertheticum]
MNKKILLISTSESNMNGHPTGLWLEELAEPYNVFKKAGLEVDIASILGGKVILDKVSIPNGIPSEYEVAYKLLENTQSLEIAMKNSYDAILFAGGHGPLMDFVNNKNIEELILDTYNNGNIVAGVCHGVAAFVNIKNKDGKYFVDGKNLTAFTDTEEVLAGLADKVPFAVESRLREQGAIIDKGADFTEKVVVDKNFITGQNPQSSHKIAEVILENLVNNK